MPLIILLLALVSTDSLAQALTSWPEWSETTVAGTSGGPVGRTRIACLGDSITAGGYAGKSWPGLLQDKLGTDYYLVHNKGVSGDTAGLMVNRWRTDIKPYSYNVLVILAGTNDLTGGSNSTMLAAYTPGSGATGYITTISDEALAMGMRVVIITILPRKGHLEVIRPDWSVDLQNRLEATNTLLWSYCQDRGIQCVDGYLLFGDPSGLGPQWMLPAYSADGLHPNDVGYDVIAIAVKPVVQ